MTLLLMKRRRRTDGPRYLLPVGRQVDLDVDARDEKGYRVPLGAVTWTTSDPSVVRLDGATATALASGVAVVGATDGRLAAVLVVDTRSSPVAATIAVWPVS